MKAQKGAIFSLDRKTSSSNDLKDDIQIITRGQVEDEERKEAQRQWAWELHNSFIQNGGVTSSAEVFRSS